VIGLNGDKTEVATTISRAEPVPHHAAGTVKPNDRVGGWVQAAVDHRLTPDHYKGLPFVGRQGQCHLGPADAGREPDALSDSSSNLSCCGPRAATETTNQSIEPVTDLASWSVPQANEQSETVA